MKNELKGLTAISWLMIVGNKAALECDDIGDQRPSEHLGAILLHAEKHTCRLKANTTTCNNSQFWDARKLCTL